METDNYLLVFSPELNARQKETIQNTIPSKTLKTIPEEHSDIIDECFNNIHAYKGSISCFYTDDINDAKYLKNQKDLKIFKLDDSFFEFIEQAKECMETLEELSEATETIRGLLYSYSGIEHESIEYEKDVGIFSLDPFYEDLDKEKSNIYSAFDTIMDELVLKH